jgi:hypothetical protein
MAYLQPRRGYLAEYPTPIQRQERNSRRGLEGSLQSAALCMWACWNLHTALCTYSLMHVGLLESTYSLMHVQPYACGPVGIYIVKLMQRPRHHAKMSIRTNQWSDCCTVHTHPLPFSAARLIATTPAPAFRVDVCSLVN